MATVESDEEDPRPKDRAANRAGAKVKKPNAQINVRPKLVSDVQQGVGSFVENVLARPSFVLDPANRDRALRLGRELIERAMSGEVVEARSPRGNKKTWERAMGALARRPK